MFVGDAESTLCDLPTASVHTCLTSPPYWSARDYAHADQIGLEDDVEQYVARLVGVFREIRRVLSDDGTAWLNLGDCYLHGCGTVNGKPPERGWKRNKQLALVPFQVVLALQEDGWWLRNTLVWHKPNAMPSSVKDRLTNTWEPVFLLTKSERYFFNLDAVRVPHITDDEVEERRRAEHGRASGKAHGQRHLRRWLNSPRHRATIEGLRTIRRRPNAPRAVELATYLRAHLREEGTFDPVGGGRARTSVRADAALLPNGRDWLAAPPEEIWRRLKELLDLGDEYDEAMEVEVADNVFRNHPLGRNPGDFTSVAVTGSAHAHFATMPLELARRTLNATLPPGGVCLDPFMGLGTTGRATLALGGRFIGIDLHQPYLRAFADTAKPRAGQNRTAGRRRLANPRARSRTRLPSRSQANHDQPTQGSYAYSTSPDRRGAGDAIDCTDSRATDGNSASSGEHHLVPDLRSRGNSSPRTGCSGSADTDGVQQ